VGGVLDENNGSQNGWCTERANNKSTVQIPTPTVLSQFSSFSSSTSIYPLDRHPLDRHPLG